MTNITGIIPSRYASSRFPGKPLTDIGGKPMIQRVYEQCLQAKHLDEVLVATDDERIVRVVEDFGGRVLMTRSDHRNGTERCAEVASMTDADYYVNIQGDEPFIHPGQIDTLCTLLDGKTQLGTLVKEVEDPSQLHNTSIMKVVLNKRQEALYFSRSCIPFVRDHDPGDWLESHIFYRHIGIYAYRKDVLQEITLLSPGLLEKAENLEQLRWLENGYTIQTAITEYESLGIDKPEDVITALNKYLPPS